MKRKYPRVKVSVSAELRCPTESFPRRAHTVDLGLGGCYFEMLATLEARSQMEVILWIDGEKVRAWAEVVGEHPHVGNCIMFTRMSEDNRVKLKAFIERVQENTGLLRPKQPVSGPSNPQKSE